MILFTVVPDSTLKPNSCSVFSMHKKAREYVQKQGYNYKTQIVASEVKGNYEYPDAVFLMKKYPTITLEGDLIDVELFAYRPRDLKIQDGYYSPIGQHIPDSIRS